MVGSIIGEPFDKFVYNQVGIRQSSEFSGYNSSRTPEEIQYLNNKSSWVKLASGVSISGSIGESRARELLTDSNQSLLSGTSLAKQSILFGGLSSQSTNKKEEFDYYIQRSGVYTGKNIWNKSFAYGIGGKDFGLQPMPGILNLNIDCVNRGSIRTAEVVIKAYNRFQFELIELLYLRIGYTMMIEWGNNKYIDNQDKKLKTVKNTIIEDKWFKENGVSQLEMIEQIRQYREKYSGNYDGFMGKVRNFTWSFEPDGTYNITLDLVTVGDVIESLQVNLPIDTTKRVELKVNQNEDENSTSLNEINNVIDEFLHNSIQEFKNSPDNNDYYILSKQIEKEEEDNKKIIQEKNYYISFQALLRKLETLVIPTINAKNQTDGNPIVSFNTDVMSNLMSYNINQTPLDPNVCIFKFNFSSEDPSVRGISTPSALQGMKEFITTINGSKAGKIMYLYLNFHFIKQCLKQNIDVDKKLSLFKFLTNICNGINSSLGGVNKLEPIIREDNIITIIDQTPIPGAIEEMNKQGLTDIVPLEVYGYNLISGSSNFVKNIDFKTSITPDLASMVSIGATAAGGTVKGIDATSFSKWNIGLEDRFNEKTEILPTETKTQEEQDKEALENWINNAEQAWNEATGSLFSLSNSQTFTSYAGNLIKTGLNTQLGTSFEYSEVEKVMNNKFTCNNSIRGVKSNYLEIAVKCYKRKKEIVKETETQKQKEQNNYILYLVNAFGGKRVLVGDNNFAPNVDPKTEAQYFKFDNDFIARGKSSYKEYLRVINQKAYEKSLKEAQKPKDVYSSNQIGFIPISLGITLKGISGIKIYNKLSINQKFLPKNYPESLHFIITKVNHQISNNEWETQLDTISIPVTDNKISKLEAPIYTTDNPEDYLIEDPIPPTPTSGNRFLIIENRNIDENTGRRTELLRNQQPQNYASPGSIIGINKVLEDINPNAKEDFRGFLTSLEENYPGYKMILNSTGRSFTKSEALREQNNKNALPGLSKHNYYAAIDFNIIDPNGVIYKKENFRVEWIKSGIPKLAENYNIGWGGNFSNYEDCIHFYYNFDINTAYQNALLSPEFRQTGDMANVDGYKVPLS